MTTTRVESLIALHTRFWNRALDEPIINSDLCLARRFQHVPALPPEWEDRDGLLLEPELIWPHKLQPAPFTPNGKHIPLGKVAFNALFPYHRVPWLVGIIGCGLKVSTSSQTVWPVSYLDDDWYKRTNQGFRPHLEWLEKLLEFTRFIIERYYPEQCFPAPDMIARGPGDLLVAALGAERLYYSFYDHPQEVKRLLEQVTDMYIRWAQSQLAIIPRVLGGYINPYGIWCPGTCIRFQEDYAINLSQRTFEEFIMPSSKQVANAFEYQVIHTHSGFSQLAEWMLELEKLKAIEVAIDPTGPSVEDIIPLWKRIAKQKCLIILGPVTPRQLDLLVSSLPPAGLWLDVEVVPEEKLAVSWEWDKTKERRKQK